MATTLKVTFDATDPHALADFWAQAVGYEVEDHTAIVEQLLAAGRLDPDEVVDRGDRKGFRDLAAARDPDGSAGPRLLFQTVPEPKTAKNRQHLDLHVGPDQAEAELERLVGLGATHLWTSTDRGQTCHTLRDPEGNEFCVE